MNSNEKRFLTISGLILAAWLLVMIELIHFYRAGYYGWVALGGGIVAFAAAAICIYFWEHQEHDDNSLAEINAMGYILVITYQVAALLVNTIFALVGLAAEYSRSLPVAINLILLAILIAIGAFLSPYRSRVAKSSAKVAAKTHASLQIAARLSELIAITDDVDVKAALRKLNEEVHYSSNISQPFTERFEDNFRDILDQIQNEIEDGRPKEEILPLIRKAEKTWLTRNGVSTSLR